MAQFSPLLPLYIHILLAVSLLAAVLTLTLFRNFFARPARLCNSQNKELKLGDTPLLPASVIVYCRDNAAQLERLLPQLLEQNYDAPFEVIVVNDGNNEDVKDVYNTLSVRHKNLRITFIPEDSHSLSRKKLSTTLGVKAARYDLVFFTNADTVIPSENWLRLMSEPFTAGADIVVGHASTNLDLQHDIFKGVYRLDTLLDTVAYLSFAIAGKPYRVNTRNLAYRKHLFFDNKGFCRTLNLHGGEDDIFISEIAQGRNIATVLSFDAQIQIDCYNPHKEHRLSKTSHIFTSKYISSRGSATLSAATWAKLVFLGSGVAASLLALPNLLPAAITTVLFLIQWIVMGITWRKIGNLLHIKANPWLAFPFMFVRPFYNLYYRVRAFIYKNRNFTWN